MHILLSGWTHIIPNKVGDDGAHFHVSQIIFPQSEADGDARMRLLNSDCGDPVWHSG